MSPTQRTLERLRAEGWECDVVECYNAHSRRRHDFLGCIDIIALRGADTMAIQCTSGSNAAARQAKIMDSPRAAAMARAGWIIAVWGWRKLAKPVDGKWWQPRITYVTTRVPT